MTKKHYITMAICGLVMFICTAMYIGYYNNYVAPKSYSVGTIEEVTYKEYQVKDYLTDEDVLFSQNINDVTFKNINHTATYEYSFDAVEFNGLDSSYIICVNDYMINTTASDVNVGTIGGVHRLNYYDIEKQVLCTSDININFSFYTMQSKLKVTLPYADLGYLMNYFKTDNFVITLAKNPFVMFDKETNTVIDLATLSAEVERLKAELEALKSTNNGLEETISELEYQVSYYEQLISKYENDNKFEVAFKFVNQALSVQLVEKNDYAIEPSDIPSKRGFVFKGWAVNGEVVDVSTYTITENTTFVATFEELPLYTMSFNVKGDVTKAYFYEGENIVAPDLDLPEGFVGWTIDGENIVDNIVVATSDITFTAVFEKFTVNYVANSDIVRTELIEIGESSVYETVPAKDDWTFYGWSVDDTNNIVDVKNYAINKDTTFTAIFTKSVFNGAVLTVEVSAGYNSATIQLKHVCTMSNIATSGYDYKFTLSVEYENEEPFTVCITNDSQYVELQGTGESANYAIKAYASSDNNLYLNSDKIAHFPANTEFVITGIDIFTK